MGDRWAVNEFVSELVWPLAPSGFDQRRLPTDALPKHMLLAMAGNAMNAFTVAPLAQSEFVRHALTATYLITCPPAIAAYPAAGCKLHDPHARLQGCRHHTTQSNAKAYRVASCGLQGCTLQMCKMSGCLFMLPSCRL